MKEKKGGTNKVVNGQIDSFSFKKEKREEELKKKGKRKRRKILKPVKIKQSIKNQYISKVIIN
jgi:hypothetical protein